MIEVQITLVAGPRTHVYRTGPETAFLIEERLKE